MIGFADQGIHFNIWFYLDSPKLPYSVVIGPRPKDDGRKPSEVWYAGTGYTRTWHSFDINNTTWYQHLSFDCMENFAAGIGREPGSEN